MQSDQSSFCSWSLCFWGMLSDIANMEANFSILGASLTYFSDLRHNLILFHGQLNIIIRAYTCFVDSDDEGGEIKDRVVHVKLDYLRIWWLMINLLSIFFLFPVVCLNTFKFAYCNMISCIKSYNTGHFTSFSIWLNPFQSLRLSMSHLNSTYHYQLVSM